MHKYYYKNTTTSHLHRYCYITSATYGSPDWAIPKHLEVHLRYSCMHYDNSMCDSSIRHVQRLVQQ